MSIPLSNIKDRLLPLFEHQIIGAGITILPTTLLYYYFYEINTPFQNLWFITTLTLIVLRLGLTIWFLKNYDTWDEVLRFRKFEDLYSCVVFLSALTWGLTVYIYLPYSVNQDILLPVLLPIGVLVGAVANLTTSYKLSIMFVLGLMTGYLGYFLINWNQLSPYMLVACFIFSFSLLKNAHKSFSLYSKLSKTLREKEQLLEQEKERTQLKEDLIQQRAVTLHAAKLASLGEMAGGIAHEINNPLTIIKMRSERLIKKYKNKELDLELAYQGLTSITETVDRIGKIVQGLLHFSGEQDAVEKTKVSIRKTLEETLNLTTEKYKTNNIKIIENLNISETFIFGNEVALSQVFINILNNSFYFIHNMENPWIQVDFIKTGENKVEIIFTDSGEPIEEEIVEKIFTPFYSNKPFGEGTGLGLSISKGIIEDHGGELFFRQDKHPCFIVSLPLYND